MTDEVISSIVDREVKIITLLNKCSKMHSHYSFEYFLPRNKKEYDGLIDMAKIMVKDYSPLYIDLTWRGDISVLSDHINLAVRLQLETGLQVMLHIACSQLSRDDCDLVLSTCRRMGICNIMALRGDDPIKKIAAGECKNKIVGGECKDYKTNEKKTSEIKEERHSKNNEKVSRSPGEILRSPGEIKDQKEILRNDIKDEEMNKDNKFSCARDFIKYIRARYGDYFCIATSGYPEGHLLGDFDMETEIDYTISKILAGADFIVTQGCFSAEKYHNYISSLRENGVRCPIIPGILMFKNKQSFLKMAKYCNITIPTEWRSLLNIDEEKEYKNEIASDYQMVGKRLITNLVRALQEVYGYTSLHLFTLNDKQTVDDFFSCLEDVK